ncbi:MAG TPA: hypothetical protein VHJ40_07205 [Actinomycetota bacterium]|nr:hypothetical protein [Actinomycetota bacterium]
MSVRKRRRDPFKSIRKFRADRQRRSSSDPTGLGLVRQQEPERRVDFWELENSPFQRHGDLDLSLFRSVPVRGKVDEWSTSVSGAVSPGTGNQNPSASSSVDRVSSNGDVHDVNGVSGEDLWPNPLSLLAEEEISYIVVDEEGRPMLNVKPPTPGSNQSRS